MFSSPGTLATVSLYVLVLLNSNGSSFGVSGAVVEPQQVSEGWNSMKQLAAILGLCAAIFFLLEATASSACLFATIALPVAFGGFALHRLCPRGLPRQLFSAGTAFGLFMAFGSITRTTNGTTIRTTAGTTTGTATGTTAGTAAGTAGTTRAGTTTRNYNKELQQGTTTRNYH